ncbi:hypothetical protein POSPLADRAFT_1066984 [Postia placenta MAD-698-R-SB12]|uniref:SET domain-containing protein n=1 Tax=Postia placenta MAD-698-R-SB12 TaxID=670580 RepID=A0A1X6MUP5_9APHY|nr:hypothetical protein POSPLADRAFT_1066984 [Postia placenta MAD-698-R-SB12]OSX59923.1 hypothetical protein POSPLADRAFT_1066984 [Postia placenta MAD-698-R-SB12]
MTANSQPVILLEPHPTARSMAVAASPLAAGDLVHAEPVLASALLQSEKGRRCDLCHRLSSDRVQLRRCTGCTSYWYCGAECQRKQWSSQHKRLCKRYPRYMASEEYQALSHHDQVDAILLSHLIAERFIDDGGNISAEGGSSMSTLMELVEARSAPTTIPPLCNANVPSDVLSTAHAIYNRFGNNNFVVHSHLNSYAHGIFPFASRSFNHSCVPNAVVKYIITPCHPVRMEVIALRDIARGDEITIPYLDPALPHNTRQEALFHNYGFTCNCDLCAYTGTFDSPALPTRGSDELAEIEADLRRFALGSSDRLDLRMMASDRPRSVKIPRRFAPLLHETYLPDTSELFSKASHEGDYLNALSAGLTLLAFYVVVYPTNYPQIGMHALELSKTAWNAIATNAHILGSDARSLEDAMQSYLAAASRILNNFGPEGDEAGPLEEIRVLQELSRTR